jgi:F-type H+-transporting ATPase subunit gamma
VANAKEIRSQIKSIRNTAKITKAMETVAASKMRKAQERMEHGRPYAEKMRTVIGHLRKARPDYRHPFMDEREAKRVAYLVISTDRGLCGGLNANLFRMLLKELRDWQEKGAEVELCLVGRKAAQFFRRLDVPVVATVQDLGDIPHVRDLIGAIQVMLNGYVDGRLDRLFMAHNVFFSTMSQRPTSTRLLPAETPDEDELQKHWDYIYEPSSIELLDGVLARYIESQVYRGAVENVACEMAARRLGARVRRDVARGAARRQAQAGDRLDR